jgi:hypothetical protein
MTGADQRSRKTFGGSRPNQTFNALIVNDRVWVEIRRY